MSESRQSGEKDTTLDERYRLAALIEEHAETIAAFAADKHRAVLLAALCLRLGEIPPRIIRAGGDRDE